MSLFSYLHIRNNFSCKAILPKIFNVYQKALMEGTHVK